MHRSPDRSRQSRRYPPDQLMPTPCRCQPRVDADLAVKERPATSPQLNHRPSATHTMSSLDCNKSYSGQEP
ncbi:hypothetical protein TIFTF001_026233 [Ficus carica]|uniref:Uncharacterized protein n=1 Tax=Ficus carica TaxID=3494 RepID=A0AA88DKU7_FICCA|nr:hypothetical protein TIFTF001_026233 [Ficus carica]